MSKRKRPNFLDLPAKYSNPASARYGVLPVPYEGTVTYGDGTADGPAAIIDASAAVELFDEELKAEFFHAGVATYPPVAPRRTPAAQMKAVHDAAAAIVAEGKFLLGLGGEHSVTAPMVQAVIEKHGPISVLQIDAHADLRDSYEGSKHSHASVMRRVMELTPRICQVGIRSFSREEFEQCPAEAANFITPAIINSDPHWIDRALSLLGPKVYVTIDIDGLDPAYAPGTGTPEPGGMNWFQITALLRAVCTHRQVLAADIVEVAPMKGNPVTEFLGARLGYKLISYTTVH
ncbi:MAG: agmatinase [Planctomycetaceae bacterium]|nr:agmatinase [Planctomycetaceae bacterium]